jgi:phosphoribosyl-ATP pyrophosphohydrolase/phosphoribosyl-AMP cyclohydrolase/histidinol dehydrogenase
METTIPLPLIPSVDLSSGPSSDAGLTRQQLGYLGCVYFTVTDQTIDKLLGFLQRHVSVKAFIDATAVAEADIVTLLDAGARTVFVKESQVATLEKYGDRIALAATYGVTAEFKAPVGGALVIADGDAAVS